MAFEVTCSQCEGRLMVEQAGVVVACPHCDAHLSVDAPPEAEYLPPDSDQDSDTDTPDEPIPPQAEVTEAAVERTEDATPDSESTETGETADAPEEVSGEPMPYFGFETTPATPVETPADELPAVVTAGPVEPQATETLEQSGSTVAVPQHEPQSEPETAGHEPNASASAVTNVSVTNMVAANAGTGSAVTASGVSRHTFTLVRNYAIAMTLAVIFLIYKLLNPNMSALESLPDVKPPKKDDKIVYKLVPEATEMPPGHLLSLGQSQRFGNLKVTPVRVTKERVEFVHHLGDTSVSREPGPEVVKLWFEFENLSSDQHIAPLDGLVFKRDDNNIDNIRSNNFVCRQSEKKKGGELVFVYDLNQFDVWNLRDQNVSHEIAPGEKIETYIPTTEDGIAPLLNSEEPLVWRVQFRKGYSPNNYGVTTVIEVAFESSDIGAA